MEQLISKMRTFHDLNSKIRSWCFENSIEQPKIMACCLEKISKLYEIFLKKYGAKEIGVSPYTMLNEPIWFENQLILFQWTVVALSFINRIQLKNFTQTQFTFFSSIFRQKQKYFINYEVNCMLIKGKQIRNSWKSEEQDLLAEIIKQMPEKKKWNEIARQLYKISQGKYFRQGKHCRQRWCSYIQAKKLQKKWTIQDDVELLQLVSVRGKKWNQILNKFTNRQNKQYLKRRFKFLLQEAKNKSSRPNSERQAIFLLLKWKHAELQSEKNSGPSQTKKGQFNEISQKKSQKCLKQRMKSDRNSPEQGSDLQEKADGNNSSGSCEQKRIDIQVEPGNINEAEENRDRMNWTLFDNSFQVFGNTLNMGYWPVQLFNQNGTYFVQSPYEPVNLINNNPLLEQNQLSFFY